MKWYHWYMLVAGGMSVANFADTLPHDLLPMLIGIPLNIVLYFVPVWLVVQVVRWFIKPSTPPTTAEPPSNTR